VVRAVNEWLQRASFESSSTAAWSPVRLQSPATQTHNPTDDTKKTCKRRPSRERLMGFEPTTFCMASRTCSTGFLRFIPANRQFLGHWVLAAITRYSTQDHGGFIPAELDPANVGPRLTLDTRRVNLRTAELFVEAPIATEGMQRTFSCRISGLPATPISRCSIEQCRDSGPAVGVPPRKEAGPARPRPRRELRAADKRSQESRAGAVRGAGDRPRQLGAASTGRPAGAPSRTFSARRPGKTRTDI
jgi:hypothetical protein